MNIRSIELRRLQLRLQSPFVTGYGREDEKPCLLLSVFTENAVGHGECVALAAPYYMEETSAIAWHTLSAFLIPLVLQRELNHPDEVRLLLSAVRGHQMAKAALETAIWDAFAKERGVSLARALGGQRTEIGVGVSVGLEMTDQGLLQKVEKHLAAGFKRIKVKIKPGRDVGVLRAIREAFGGIALMADANSAYRLSDLEHLRRLDEFGLMMIEQPLAYDDLIDHARLQQELATPICLDESIRSLEDGRKAIEIGACRVMNIKVGRVGGLSEARDLQALCLQSGVDAWCGGMLEAGVGRLTNIAFSSLSGCTLPGDTAPSSHYFAEDIIQPPVEFSRSGFLAVPTEPGIGAELREEVIAAATTQKRTF